MTKIMYWNSGVWVPEFIVKYLLVHFSEHWEQVISKLIMGGGKMLQWVKELAAKADSLSSMSKIYIVEGERTPLSFLDLNSYIMVFVCDSLYTHV